MIFYNDVEWSFFHWDNQEGRPSDVTITNRVGDNYSINKFTLPQEVARDLERKLQEESDRTQIKKIRENLRREVNVGDVIDIEHYGRVIVYSTDSMCGDIYLLSVDGEQITERYSNCDKIHQLVEKSSKGKWIKILNNKKRELKKENDYNDNFEECFKILRDRI